SILAIQLALPIAGIGQTHYFRHYQVENGLSNNTVFTAIQDSAGFLWFGTKEGLNRFDGYNFKTFKFHSSAKDWAERELIFALYNDQRGRLWVGTQHGLYRFDREHEQLVPFFKQMPNVNGIQSDARGRLWFISGVTIFRYDEKKNELKEFPASRYFGATSVCLSEQNEIWFSASNGTLQKFDPASEKFTSYNIYTHSPVFQSCSVEKITAGGPETLYIGTSCQGIKEFNTSTGEYRDLLVYNTDKTPVYVRDILKYSDQQYWFATESGIFILDKSTNTFTNLRKKYLDPYSLNDNAVYALCKDFEGGVWAGTYFGGVNYYAAQYSAFRKYFDDNLDNSFKGSAVREIRNDRYGNLWIGTEDAGLNKIDPTGKTTNFVPDGSPGSISYSNIHGMLVTGDELWLGTHEHGLDVLDVRTGKVIRHHAQGKVEGELTSNFIVFMLETRDGNIYLGTSNSVHHYDKKNQKFSRVKAVPDNVFVSTLAEAHDGTIWVGTHGYGVCYFNPHTGQSGRLEHKAGDETGLTANTVNSIIEDSKHNIWIGTEGGGVVKIAPDRKTVTGINTSNGLPSNFIFKVLEDKSRNIWLTSSKGLIGINAASGKIKIFTRSSGLLNDQFNYNSGYVDSTGRLYFGAITHTRKVDLSSEQSSFSIDFAALSFVSPDATTYRYRMDGVDDEWNNLTGNRKVYFTDLSPGNYTFRVQAGMNGSWVGSETTLDIRIHPPVWATGTAFVLYSLVIAGVAWVIIRFFIQRAREKKEKEIYTAKIDFFTNVAHEIRTPLTLIKGPVENIGEHIDAYPEIREDVHTLERNTDRLISLVSGVLDFRKTETRGFRLDFAKVALNEVLEENFLDFKPLAVKKKLSYQLTMEQDVDLYADPEALQKIISNLLSNAIKYAGKSVEIVLKKNNEQDKAVMLVMNDGFKIPEHIREKI
ncbi:MAG: sensor histidine kinase, partial [Chitinophagaceae bacterium]